MTHIIKNKTTLKSGNSGLYTRKKTVEHKNTFITLVPQVGMPCDEPLLCFLDFLTMMNCTMHYVAE